MLEMAQGSSLPGAGPEVIKERAHYIAEAEPIGTVPYPTGLKGIANTLLEKLQGDQPEVLIDKLGERLAFERTGTRLYELLIQKVETGREPVPPELLGILWRNREEEERHFHLVHQALERLGADPTAVTPSADIGAVSSFGLLQVLADPRTTVLQGLQALLVAELTDREGWELLIQLMNQAGAEGVDGFQLALREEARHLSDIRAWYSAWVSGEVKVEPAIVSGARAQGAQRSG